MILKLLYAISKTLLRKSNKLIKLLMFSEKNVNPYVYQQTLLLLELKDSLSCQVTKTGDFGHWLKETFSICFANSANRI